MGAVAGPAAPLSASAVCASSSNERRAQTVSLCRRSRRATACPHSICASPRWWRPSHCRWSLSHGHGRERFICILEVRSPIRSKHLRVLGLVHAVEGTFEVIGIAVVLIIDVACHAAPLPTQPHHLSCRAAAPSQDLRMRLARGVASARITSCMRHCGRVSSCDSSRKSAYHRPGKGRAVVARLERIPEKGRAAVPLIDLAELAL